MTSNTIVNLAYLAVSLPLSCWALWSAVTVRRRVLGLLTAQGRALESANSLIEQMRVYQQGLEDERGQVRRMLSATTGESTVAAVIRFAGECRGAGPAARPRKDAPS